MDKACWKIVARVK